MPEGTEEKNERTAEEVAATETELNGLKEKFGKVTFKSDGKPVTLNLHDQDDWNKALQFMSGGAHLEKEMAKLKADKEALEKTFAERVQAEVTKQRGAGQPAAADGDIEQTVAAALEGDADFARAVEEGDAKAQAKAIAKATAAAVRAAGAKKPELPEGLATKQDIADSEKRVAAAREYETQVRGNAQHKALVAHLAKANGESTKWAEQELLRRMGELDLPALAEQGLSSTDIILKHVVAPLSEKLGVKAAEPEPGEDEGAREKPPRSAGSAAGAPGGAGHVRLDQPADLRAAIDKAKEKRRKGQSLTAYERTLIPVDGF